MSSITYLASIIDVTAVLAPTRVTRMSVAVLIDRFCATLASMIYPDYFLYYYY